MKLFKKTKEAGIFAWFSHNWNYKILSFLVAVLLWLGAVRDRETSEIVRFPIRFTGLSENLVVSTIEPSHISFLIKGKARELLKHGKDKNNWFYEIDMTGLKKGDYKLNVSKRNVMNFHSSLDMYFTEEGKTIAVTIDEKEEKFVKVIPEITGKVASGHKQIGEVQMQPQFVKIRGPKSVSSIVTSAIDISDEKKTITREAVLILPPNTDLIDTTGMKVFATVVIAELKTLELNDVPILVRGEYSLLAPKILKITVRVPIDYTADKVRADIAASIDLSTYSRNELLKLKPVITIPSYAELVNYIPAEIQVIKR